MLGLKLLMVNPKFNERGFNKFRGSYNAGIQFGSCLPISVGRLRSWWEGLQEAGLQTVGSGVAKAFPGGRLAHPEGQNEEEKRFKFEEN